MKKTKFDRSGKDSLNASVEQLKAKIKSKQNSRKEEQYLVGLLNESTNQDELCMAIQLASELKLVDSISKLYYLLTTPGANPINLKHESPASALINIGKKGLPDLFRAMSSDNIESIPYQSIASILFHWFDGKQEDLKQWLEKEQTTAKPDKRAIYKGILEVVNNWKVKP